MLSSISHSFKGAWNLRRSAVNKAFRAAKNAVPARGVASMVANTWRSRTRFRLFYILVTGVASTCLVYPVMCESDSRKDRANQDLFNTICDAAASGDLSTVKQLIEKNGMKDKLVNARHVAGWTALHAAAANGHRDLVLYLLEEGADPNAADFYEYYPKRGLSLSDLRHYRQQFHPTLHYGLEADTAGWTPLHYATALGHPAVVEALLDHGADEQARSARGFRAPDFIEWHEGEGDTIGPALRHSYEQAEKRAEQRDKELRVKFPLEEKLRRQMVGQLAPIYSVAGALRRRDNGWFDENKPLVMLFLGSSGVGKTMLAKLLADEVVKKRVKSNKACKEHGFIRLDMSEYHAEHEASRLIGAPPGYVGHDQGGQLTAALSKCPEAVVLLDEIEKAHPEVLTLMLQVFDEGRLTDGKGRTIHCPRAIFVLTSNLVQEEIREASEGSKWRLRPVTEDKHEIETKVLPDTHDFLRLTVHPILKRHFKRDEFLGRINDMVVFHPFSQTDLRAITEMELRRWAGKAAELHNMKLTWTEKLVDALAKGFDERYGFRSIKYAVEKRFVDVLARAHERDEIGTNQAVDLDLSDDGRVIIRSQQPLPEGESAQQLQTASSEQKGNRKSFWPWK